MTAHGAKGLEAPIVILPETTMQPRRGPRGSPLLDDARAAASCGAPAQARTTAPPRPAPASAREAASDDEALRLLYVALTRARDRLVLCGRDRRRPPRTRTSRAGGAPIRDGLRPRRHRAAACATIGLRRRRVRSASAPIRSRWRRRRAGAAAPRAAARLGAAPAAAPRPPPATPRPRDLGEGARGRRALAAGRRRAAWAASGAAT